MSERTMRRFGSRSAATVCARRACDGRVSTASVSTALLAMLLCATIALAKANQAPAPQAESASELFDRAVSMLSTDARGSQGFARRAALKFQAALESNSARGQGLESGLELGASKLLYNTGTAYLLARDYPAAVLWLRRAECHTAAWDFTLRRNTLNNLHLARKGAQTSLAAAEVPMLLAPADADRSWLAHSAVLVPVKVWFAFAVGLAALGSLIGFAKLLHRVRFGHGWSLGLVALGAAVAYAAHNASEALTSHRSAIVVAVDALPRSAPDGVLGTPVALACPAGTEVVIAEVRWGGRAADPAWVRLQRSGDEAKARFWLPASSVETIPR